MSNIEVDELRISPDNEGHTRFRDDLMEVLSEEWQDTPTVADKANEETDEDWKWSYIRYTQIPEWLKYLRSEGEIEMKKEDEEQKEKGEAKQFWRLSE